MAFARGMIISMVLVIVILETVQTFPRKVVAFSGSATLFSRPDLPYSPPLPVDKNGEIAVDKVVGGQLARVGQFPWMAVIHKLLGGNQVEMCGGSILSVRWVLTAGHCVANGPLDFNVYFGLVDKTGIGYNYFNGAGITMHTNQGALHPQYGFGQGVNDIAILYMPQDIIFTSSIQPIRLAGSGNAGNTFAGLPGFIMGWGQDGTLQVEHQNHMKFAVLTIIENSSCKQQWPFVNDGNICTLRATGSDTCQGDSGGPLVVLVQNEAVQVGIVSYGDNGCPSSLPGVFTRVTYYIPWIKQVTGIDYY